MMTCSCCHYSREPTRGERLAKEQEIWWSWTYHRDDEWVSAHDLFSSRLRHFPFQLERFGVSVKELEARVARCTLLCNNVYGSKLCPPDWSCDQWRER